MDGYITAFFPSPFGASQASEEVRERIKSYCDPAGSLRLWVNRDSLTSIDIQKLLRFRLRFPDYAITPTPAYAWIPEKAIDTLSVLLNNKSPKWIKWLKQHVITQVVLLGIQDIGQVRIVVKATHCPGWQKFFNDQEHDHDDLIQSLRLKDLTRMIRFGVDF